MATSMAKKKASESIHEKNTINKETLNSMITPKMKEKTLERTTLE